MAAGAAQAQDNGCAGRGEIVAMLAERYGEQPQSVAIDATGRRPLQRLFRYQDGDPSNDRGDAPEALPPIDTEYHACVLRNSQQFRCFYNRLDGV